MPNNSFDEVMQYSPCEFCMHSAAFVVDYLFKDGCKIKGHDIYLGKVLLGFHHIFKSNTLHVSLGRLWLLWKQQNYGVWLPNQRFGGIKSFPFPHEAMPQNRIQFLPAAVLLRLSVTYADGSMDGLRLPCCEEAWVSQLLKLWDYFQGKNEMLVLVVLVPQSLSSSHHLTTALTKPSQKFSSWDLFQLYGIWYHERWLFSKLLGHLLHCNRKLK